ncbi:HalX domain-containing protein [Halobacterium zhouii]|uniref:HalX domain-containing protein n=1 Tax=Halobacterium zhouii TaxID=2902624 RepID=UPI001E2D2861|nr:HalX domain-containing protein [Halobacterium zhouii]
MTLGVESMPTPAQQHPPARPVLIAHPDSDTVSQYDGWLPDYCTAQSALCGREAIEKHTAETSVAILDEGLAECCAEEVAAKICGTEASTKILSTRTDPSQSAAGKRSVFDDTLASPIAEADFRSTVESLHRRATYDKLLGEYYTLARERATLESKTLTPGSQEAVRYTEVISELAELEAALERALADFDDADYRAVFEVVLA